ncbi:MAG: hypothetical protein EOP06_17660 [Proteobacteria bacterium]|nr:MAG: hypothetical protein EOP06_17660 [Pseudomonadota bacterium]
MVGATEPLNIIEQVHNLYKTSIIQKALKTDSPPQLHSWVYELSDGLLVDLKWQEEQFKKLDHIYNSNPQEVPPKPPIPPKVD